ncbi:AAA family ATPase [Leptospira sp. GIMC2001]|uniref:AAA family ATPase n=1 Tax=Leptospira sp. GIMC2001 TaxID=1513297 RepID=UPI0023499819|nr:AAA family ATPase [Leptospira sp. GIMC2001]WCL51476.1 AAA family ATPase [Leptospira sp. GIMC2001]
MLESIKIQGFKSIKELDIELRPINILIGSNGVGKSNFISFFNLVNNVYEGRLQEFSLKSGVDNILHYGRKNSSEVTGHLKFGDNGYSFNLKPSEEGTFFISEEKSYYYPAQGRQSNSNINIKESRIKSSTTFRDKYLRNHLKSYKIYHFHDTSISAPMRSSANVNDNRTLREDGGNLPAYLYYLQEKHPIVFKRIEKVIESVVPFFESFALSPTLLNEEKILLEWIEKEHPEMYFNANHLSDGSLRFIALVTLLMQPSLPKVIIIDEPELGLHPMAIVKLSGLLKSAAAKDCQIIVSTQSVTLLNNFEAEDIITVDKENNQSVFRRLGSDDLGDWLNEYSIGDLWVKRVIKGQPQ